MNIQINLSRKNILLNKSKNKNILGEETRFTIKNNMKSVNIPELYFSNYFKSRNDYYKSVEKILKRLVTDSSSIKEFIHKDLNRNVEFDKRLEKIHLDTYNYSYGKIPFIYRLAHFGNSSFQIYLIGNSEYSEIVFIDLYHLLLPAADCEHGEVVKNPIKHYNEVKSYKEDISSIITKVKELEN